jgi:glutamate/tyrosine decarboxylase-like PLP-dependent enzyme
MTELEMKMTDWLATAIGLPDCFKNSDPGPGAGMIQSTASDSTFIAVLSARARAVSVTKFMPGLIRNF